jgi:preprotein translocase subunit Sss1
MKIFQEIYKFSKSEEGKTRLKILEFFEAHGLQATRDAYGISKTTLYRWHKMFLTAKRNQIVLIPRSRSPKRKRVMRTDWRIVKFIKETRQEHPRLSKWKIKPLLDEYCTANNIRSIGLSTIGKVIKRNDLFFQKSGRIYHSPKSAWNRRKYRYKTKVKYSPKVTESGYYEIDTVQRFIGSIRVYIFNAVDVHTRFQFSYAYRTGSSGSAKDFFKKLECVSPFQVKKIQTDNGSEYQGDFAAHLRHRKLEQVYIYPHCPKINGYVERANRSLSEEFIEHNDCTCGTFNLREFNAKLIEHLIWFNTKRVHRSLGNLSPLAFWTNNSEKSHMCVTHTNCS